MYLERIMSQLASLRKNYMRGALSETEVQTDPIVQFNYWFEQALNAQLYEPNAMTLATADAHGKPSARIVLLKGVDDRGLVFFTNYNSLKGQALAENPQAALLFYWPELERQVRITGKIEKVSEAESDAYYASRPLDSRIGAWASEQSQVISDRSVLVKRAALFSAKFALQPARPPYWGGYRLLPEYFEFWQGRSSRLHDRICYQREDDGQWRIFRLAP